MMKNIKDFFKWDRRFLSLAVQISSWSKDPSTKVGCVIVNQDRHILSTGFNGFPAGVADLPERLNNREKKYTLICHAEENAIAHAARVGLRLEGSILYTTFPPCIRCAVTIIQAGIASVISQQVIVPDRWENDLWNSRDLLREAGLRYSTIPLKGKADVLVS